MFSLIKMYTLLISEAHGFLTVANGEGKVAWAFAWAFLSVHDYRKLVCSQFSGFGAYYKVLHFPSGIHVYFIFCAVEGY